ncbi:MAG: hypothetical protein ABI720_12910, partial [Actinomycetes bacterium]
RTVSELIVRAAAMREESRGSHRRRDFDQPSDRWRHHIVQRWDGSSVRTSTGPVKAEPGEL